ncbi:hypothetical protein [Lederbergia citrea]|uniref:Uncharacterized protein n=1 Tax=Lederbergia citrea TaxID=2833581 RepID=A0A942Z6T6_9BACI|nr:hypothetical protein [Lederbergia citrea]MBS4179578.1 hypothetical protein [Lederbergia citrea]MBS4206245.1 hypothetical protein [Lederbergia citrea]MBS4224820.1 hypothetical protein [Lederbergia citrea]
MYTFLTYSVSLFVIVISVFITLFVKYELEQMFREKKDVVPFHICNVVITLMVSCGAHAVMTIYIIGNEFNLILQLVILMFIIIPIYISGHFAFEKYKSVYRKYINADNGKVIVLNEKYLKKKKLPSKLKNYNAISKEK